MHRYELNPRLMSAEDQAYLSRREFLKWAAAITAGAGVGAVFLKYLSDLSKRPKEEVDPKIAFEIPGRYKPNFAKLAEMGVPVQLREGIARTIQTESKFNHYARGRHKDFGMFQITAPKLEDTVGKALMRSGSDVEMTLQD